MSLAKNIEALLGEQLTKLRDGRHAIRPPTNLERRVSQIRAKFGNGHADLINRQRIESAIEMLSTKGPGSLTSRTNSSLPMRWRSRLWR